MSTVYAYACRACGHGAATLAAAGGSSNMLPTLYLRSDVHRVDTAEATDGGNAALGVVQTTCAMDLYPTEELAQRDALVTARAWAARWFQAHGGVDNDLQWQTDKRNLPREVSPYYRGRLLGYFALSPGASEEAKMAVGYHCVWQTRLACGAGCFDSTVADAADEETQHLRKRKRLDVGQSGSHGSGGAAATTHVDLTGEGDNEEGADMVTQPATPPDDVPEPEGDDTKTLPPSEVDDIFVGQMAAAADAGGGGETEPEPDYVAEAATQVQTFDV